MAPTLVALAVVQVVFVAPDSRADDAVWYFGEGTRGLDAHGKLTDPEGSWRTGVDGAEPGVFMGESLSLVRYAAG